MCDLLCDVSVNDLADLPSDRIHPTKRERPLASGQLPVSAAVAMAALGLILGPELVLPFGMAPLSVLAGYVLVTLLYTFALKRIPIVDVFVIAVLFTSRLAFGIALTGVRLSPWLLVFSMFTFLSLCLAKRNTEICLMRSEGGSGAGRGYVTNDGPLILGLGLSAALGAVLILILYLIEDAFPLGFYRHPQFLWVLPGILFLVFGRIWLVSQRSELCDDPVEFVLTDRQCLLYAVAALSTIALALA